LSNKNKRILVPLYAGYGRSVEALGEITTDYRKFFSNPAQTDMVLFTGGEDIDPKFYEDKSPHRLCSFRSERDELEISIFEVALERDIPMIGICRGLQLFNVMAGGKLMHHISGHGGSLHDIDVLDGTKQDTFIVNSMHHQMIIPEEDDSVIITGWSTDNLSGGVYYGTYDERVDYNGVEIEAATFPKLKAFGVQYHPECMKKDTAGFIYFESLARDMLNNTWEKFMTMHSPAKENKLHKTITTTI